MSDREQDLSSVSVSETDDERRVSFPEAVVTVEDDNDLEPEFSDLKLRISDQELLVDKYNALAVFGNFQNHLTSLRSVPPPLLGDDEDEDDEEYDEDEENDGELDTTTEANTEENRRLSEYGGRGEGEDEDGDLNDRSKDLNGSTDVLWSSPSRSYHMKKQKSHRTLGHVTLTRMVMKRESLGKADEKRRESTGSTPASISLQHREQRAKTVKRMKNELRANTKVDQEMLRLQQQLKMSNATAREFDQVILLKHHDDINKNAADAEKNIEYIKEFGYMNGFNTLSAKKGAEMKQKIESLKHAQITMEERLDRAAMYIRDAIDGRETKSRSPLGILIWRLSLRWWYKLIMYIIILFNLSLVFGEPSSYRNSGGVQTSTVMGLHIAECVCVFFYIVDIVLRGMSNGWHHFFKSRSRSTFIFIVTFIFCDTVAGLILGSTLRPTRCLRPLLLIAKSRTLREIITTILRTLLRLVDLILLVFILMITYAVIGVQLFSGVYPAETSPQNFDSTQNALLTLYVLLTTENYPTIMEPAYVASPWSVIYFLSYLLIVVYLLMSVLVAVVLDTYKSLRKERLIKDRVIERKGLATAFQLLDVHDVGHIEYSLWEQLFKIVSPSYDPTQVRLLFQTIDEDQNGKINIIEFFELCDVLLLRFRKDDSSGRSVLPSTWLSFLNQIVPRRAAMGVLRTRIFHIVIVLVILANIVILCLLGSPIDTTRSRQLYIVNLVFLCCYIVEMGIKITALGSQFWKHMWNRFDFGIVVLITAAQITVFGLIGGDAFTVYDRGIVRFFNAIAALRVLRVISSFRRTRLITYTVMKIAPLMLSVITLVLCVFYFYAVIGMEIFMDKVELNEVTRFHNFQFAMLALFQQLTQSDWHNVMYFAMDNTSFSVSWYFVTFNVIVVVIILNLLIALVIDTFVLQHDILRSEQDILLEIPDADNRVNKSRWHVWKDLGSKWERELINRADIPELKEEDMRQVDKHAKAELARMSRLHGRRSSNSSSSKGSPRRKDSFFEKPNNDNNNNDNNNDNTDTNNNDDNRE